MERRKFLVGLGSLAAGGAAAMGTGAFTSTRVRRTMNVRVAQDAMAFLALRKTGSPNSKYVSIDNKGALQVNLDKNAAVSGWGLGTRSRYDFDSVFKIVNLGSQPVDVWVDYTVASNGSIKVYNQSNATSIKGSNNSVSLGVGDELVVSFDINTDNLAQGTQMLQNNRLTIHASA